MLMPLPEVLPINGLEFEYEFTKKKFTFISDHKEEYYACFNRTDK
jgi:hypothetical protein